MDYLRIYDPPQIWLSLTGGWRGFKSEAGKAIGSHQMSAKARDAYDEARKKGEAETMRKIAEEQHKIRKDSEAAKAAAKQSARGSTNQGGGKRTQEERLVKSDKVVEATRKRLSSIDKKMSDIQKRIEVAEQAKREGMQMVQTKRVKQRREDGVPIPKQLVDEFTPELRVSRRKANAKQMAKIDDTINNLYDQLSGLSSRRDQILNTGYQASKIRSDYEFAKQRGLS